MAARAAYSLGHNQHLLRKMKSLLEEPVVTPPPMTPDMIFDFEDSVVKIRQQIGNLHVPVDTEHVRVGESFRGCVVSTMFKKRQHILGKGTGNQQD